MGKYYLEKFRSLAARKLTPARRKLEELTNEHWHEWPFGREPRASEKEYLRFDETRTEAIKNVQSIINSSLSEDIEKLKEYNKTCSEDTGDHNGS